MVRPALGKEHFRLAQIGRPISRPVAAGAGAVDGAKFGQQAFIHWLAGHTRGSGNADFDESVTAQMTRIQQTEGNIPPPPEEVADQYLGRSVTLNFRGRDARR
jgi:hypothetical protein